MAAIARFTATSWRAVMEKRAFARVIAATTSRP
jgi:hypothetical protein